MRITNAVIDLIPIVSSQLIFESMKYNWSFLGMNAFLK